MAKNVDFEVGFTDKGAKAGFNEVSESIAILKKRVESYNEIIRLMSQNETMAKLNSEQLVIAYKNRVAVLDQLTKMQAKQDVAVKQSTRRLGSLASAAMSATGSISGLGTGISTLTYAIMSGVGLTGGLAAAVIGFSLLMSSIRGAREEQEKLKNEIEAFITIVTEKGTFNLKPEEIPGKLQAAKDKLASFGGVKGVPIQESSIFMKMNWQQEINQWKATIEVLEEANKKYNDQLIIKQNLSELGMTWTSGEKDKTKAVKEHTKSLEALANPLKMLIDLYKKMNEQELPTGMGGLPSKFRMGTVPIPQKPIITLTDQEFAKQNEQWIEGIYTTLDIMRSEFNQAWADIFGEANSIFEKLIAGWADVFANAFIKKGLGMFLGLFPGGSLLNEFLGLDDFIWRPGQRPVSINPNDTIVGTKSGEYNSREYNSREYNSREYNSREYNGREYSSQIIILEVDKIPFAKVVLNANNRANKLRLQ